MMRLACRWLAAALVMCLLFAGSGAAAGEESAARDIREECAYSSSGGRYKMTRLYDGQYNTTFKSFEQRHPWIEVKAPEGEAICGVYLAFGEKVYPWEIRAEGESEAAYTSEGLYAHEYAPLEGVSSFRIRLTEDRQRVLEISEIRVFTEGALPEEIQIWQPPLAKADLLVLAGHPDDEILFFGGLIPYYAAERGLAVQAAYLTCGTYERRSELLDALWYAGVRNYPLFGGFWDKYSKKLSTAYDAWGKRNVDRFLVEAIRACRPEVMVTHDVNGEYGHGAHRVCADAALRCVGRAADAGDLADLGEAWQVKKLYLHLFKEGQITMDWDQPLSTFGGLTGYQVAEKMYLMHRSQQGMGQKVNGKFEVFIVEPRDSDYSCYRFGLAFSTVGEDEAGGDMFEHVLPGPGGQTGD